MFFFSLKTAQKNLFDTIKRFPIVSALTVLGTSIGLVLIEMEFAPNKDYSFLYNLLITSILGVFVFLSIQLIIERWKFDSTKKMVFQFGGLVFLCLYFFLLPDVWENARGSDFIRMFLLTLAFVFSITFAPFIRAGEINGFWQYNKTLFLRLFLAFVYGGVLFIGLVLALVAIDTLLGIDVSEKLYPELWVFITGILVSHFFLSGIPEDFKKLEKEKEYPATVKFFSQYILFSLMVVYCLILIAYLGKIAFTGVWPEGQVSWLIILFSIVGIITYVLLFPLGKDTKNLWVRYYSKGFFVIEFPFIVMLFIAIGIRINEYGLTEARYYAVALGVWLTLVALYFLFSKNKNIKLIPASLFIIILVTSFGPWGAIAMSEVNQVARLESVLKQHNILVDGKIQTVQVEATIPKEDVRQISAILEYLDNVHGFKKIDNWFEENLDEYLESKREARRNSKSFSEDECWNDACRIIKLMGLSYIQRWEFQDNQIKIQSFYTEHTNVKNIAGFDTLFEVYLASYNNFKEEVDALYSVRFSQVENFVEIKKGEEPVSSIAIGELIQKLQNDFSNTTRKSLDHDELTVFSENENTKVVIHNVNLTNEDDLFEVESMNLLIMIKD